MKSPKISIIIPVYNVANYIERCLDSIINQSFKDIEIICVNDCSSDNSLDILRKYEESNNRITIISKEQNEGLLLARKSGVMASNGEYIIFLDSDDYVRDGLCEFIANYTDNNDIDILQFNIEVEDNTFGSDNAKWLKNALRPLDRRLNKNDIITEAYINRSYVTSLVGKVFSAELCKKVYSIIPDEHCYVGEDIFTYFLFSYFADSYVGVNTPGYYIYRYGLGVENADCMTLSKFEQYCKMSYWVEYTKQFLNDNYSNDIIKTAFEKMKQRMFEDCCKIYKQRISESEKDDAAKLIVKYWKNDDVTNTVMQDKIGMTMDKFIYQANVPVYVKHAEAYKDVLPKVSIVIPVYNVETYISECIDSVINQTLKDIEIVCVNDGSPDNSLSIIEKYASKDKRITVISRKNGGLSAARNTGAKYAKGKYIYFLDSDDFVTKDSLENLYKLSEKENLDILYFGVQNFYESNNIEKQDIIDEAYYQRKQYFDHSVTGDVLFERFLKENMFICCVPFQFINREFLIKSGICFREGILHEDELFSPQLILAAERTMVIEDKFYIRRIRENSIMTTSYTHRNFIGYFISYTTLTSNLITNNCYSKSAKNALNIYARKLYNTSNRIYKHLSECEKNKVFDNIPEEFRLFAEPFIERDKTINSYPYIIGMKITYIPRKLAAVVNSLRKKGLKETVQLIKQFYFK